MILVAEHLDDRSRRVTIDAGDRPIRIGRNPGTEELNGEPVDVLQVPWNDRLINRAHSVARRDGDDLVVERLPKSDGRQLPNTIYTNAPVHERQPLEDPVRLPPGSSFVVGRLGRTVFSWVRQLDDLDAQTPSVRPRTEPLSARSLFSGPLGDVARLDDYTLRLQLQMLQRELPEKILSGWNDERDLFIRAASFVDGALPNQRGVAAAFIALDPSGNDGQFELLSPDPTTRADFSPSRKLLATIDQAAKNGGPPQIWTPQTHPEEFASSDSLQRSIEWVAAIPVVALDDNASVYHAPGGQPVYLYVETSSVSSPEYRDARPYLPFLRMIGALVASLLSAREKQRIQDQMSAYFSPALREKMSGENQRALEPAMTDCTVIFVDRRGSSKILETANSDEAILDQLRDNQDIVGEITQTVFDHDGVITDFSGDGVLALWGWPPDTETHDAHARLAVDTAAAIARRLESRTEFDEQKQHRFSTIRVGVSTGRLAVGKTGPSQQMHISVFGSVANLGARLEKIAKDFRVPVLLSGETVARLQKSPDTAPHTRRLCYIKPAGFQQSYPIFELVLPRSIGGSSISESDTEKYERALDAFVERRWDLAEELLCSLPEDDGPTLWLLRETKKFRKKDLADEWQGEIESLSK